MRITSCLLALLVAASTGLAQETIEWSAQRRLAKADFRGRVPAAASHASLSAINIETAWECEDGALVATARATFDPSRSWWRHSLGGVWDRAGADSSRTQQNARLRAFEGERQLLEHEQLHFDIAEVTVRKINARFGDFTNGCREAGGTEPIQQMVVQADRELQEEQQRYDRETGHGVNARAQEQWKSRIRTLLN